MHAPPAAPQVAGACDSQVAPLQQPFGQVALQPVHTLLSQFCVEPHGLQADPPPPHAVLEVPGMHVDPEQQPPGHDVPLHTQEPLTHTWPDPHRGLLPHWQVPPTHPSESEGEQVLHEPPPVPHAPVDCGSQTLPLQQPLGHEVELQTQLPLTHA